MSFSYLIYDIAISIYSYSLCILFKINLMIEIDKTPVKSKQRSSQR